MDPSTTRASLLARVRDGSDNQAWGQFARSYGDLIVRYARARGLQYCDAEDVRQVVLLYLSRALREFRYTPERGRFRDYLGTASRNAVNRFLSRPKGAAACLSIDGIAEPAAADRDALWEQEWVDHHYRMALEAIRDRCEARTLEVFERLLGGATVAETAREFGMSAEAVEKVRQRLRERLRVQVAAQLRAEDDADG